MRYRLDSGRQTDRHEDQQLKKHQTRDGLGKKMVRKAIEEKTRGIEMHQRRPTIHVLVIFPDIRMYVCVYTYVYVPAACLFSLTRLTERSYNEWKASRWYTAEEIRTSKTPLLSIGLQRVFFFFLQRTTRGLVKNTAARLASLRR